MYYEDQARQFNLLSGLLVGVALGAGIGLLSGSLGGVRLPIRRHRRKSLATRLGAYGSDARDAVVSTAKSRVRQFGR